ncbi:MAG: hypothetical protein J8272_00975, partial ['Prunus persica' phytoplasma PP2]|nr:hypothetical protein ['Prunus persica' phytoplasma PP2]
EREKHRVRTAMVKAVVGEETQLKLAEDRLEQSSTPAQVLSLSLSLSLSHKERNMSDSEFYGFCLLCKFRWVFS